MKLYVWHNVFCDYTCGIAFAMAESAEEARRLIRENAEDWEDIDGALADEPEVYDGPHGEHILGGG
jgi:hypothetical protein